MTNMRINVHMNFILFLQTHSRNPSMAWSPEHATKAYLQTLELCRDYCIQDDKLGRSKSVEPQCMEYISALAAGNRAQLMVEISYGGLSPLTIALAIASKQTGGRVVCILNEEELHEAETQIASYDLEDVLQLVIGNPCDVIKQYKNIDFAVIDGRVRNQAKLYKSMDLNPSGSVVVVNNIFYRKSTGATYGQSIKGIGVESVVLPIGEGMEVTRVGWGKKQGLERSSKKRYMYVH